MERSEDDEAESEDRKAPPLGVSCSMQCSRSAHALQVVIVSHNCQRKAATQALTLASSQALCDSVDTAAIAITCMQEPLQVHVTSNTAASQWCHAAQRTVRYLGCERDDWSSFALCADTYVPYHIQILNVHLNPRPWPQPGHRRREDLAAVVSEVSPHIVAGDFNELRGGPCDQWLRMQRYVELTQAITDPTWYSQTEASQNIDRIYCRTDLLPHVAYASAIGHTFGSDHARVICRITD